MTGSSAQTDRVRVVIATPLAPELCARMTAVDPRVEVLVDHSLLPPMRHPGDHSGDPRFHRDRDEQHRFEELLARAEVLYGIPGEDPDALARAVASNAGLRWVHTMAAGGGGQVVGARLTPQQHAQVTFTTSAGVHGIPLAEFSVFGILAGSQDLPRLQRQQRAHEWPARVLSRPVSGSTVLVIGLGGIGAEVASRCAALGMRVLGTRRHPEPVPGVDEVHAVEELPDIIGQADHVVVTLPGTAHTANLLGAKLLSRTKRGVTVVNVGRGTVIDEAALVESLRSGQVGLAVLDVFATEPLPADSPLWDLDNVIVSPHSAALDAREDEQICDLFCENLRAFLDGRPLANVVDPELGY